MVCQLVFLTDGYGELSNRTDVWVYNRIAEILVRCPEWIRNLCARTVYRASKTAAGECGKGIPGGKEEVGIRLGVTVRCVCNFSLAAMGSSSNSEPLSFYHVSLPGAFFLG